MLGNEPDRKLFCSVGTRVGLKLLGNEPDRKLFCSVGARVGLSVVVSVDPNVG